MAFVALLLLSAVASPAAWGQGSPPPLSHTRDVLAGKRTLLSIDNLLVTGSFFVANPNQGQFAFCAHDCLVTPSFYLQTTAPNTLALFETVLSASFEGAPFAADLVATSTNVGRLFHQPHDVLVRMQSSVLQAAQNPLITVVLEDLTETTAGPIIPFPEPYSPPSGATHAGVNATVLADLNGDGLDEIATNVGAGTLRVGTATNVSDMGAGLTWGPPLSTMPFKTMTAGDFDGDGQTDLAAAFFDAVANTGVLAIYSVDPKTLAVTLRRTLAVPVLGVHDTAALTAGRYTNVGADQLVLAVNSATAGSVLLFSYSVDGQFAIRLRGTFGNFGGSRAPELSARSASLDALGGLTAQVVIGFGGTNDPRGGDSFGVFSFDDQLNFLRQGPLTFLSCVNCLRDVAIGNFTQAVSPTLEIAVLSSSFATAQGPPGPIHVGIYQINATTFAPTLASAFMIPTSAYPSREVQFLRIAAGDTLGRGLRLGAPSKLTVRTHLQPQIVLGMPPMHVDAVPPSGSHRPVVLNVSAVPESFYAQYTTEVVSGTQSSTTSTTSYSFGTSTTDSSGGTEQGVVKGVDIGSFSAQTQSTTASAHEHFVAKQYDNFSGQSFDASTRTGHSDHVWFTSENFNVFIYPVIGHAACPVDQPGCAEGEKKPLVVLFSGPDTPMVSDGDGATLEWYQPVHEPFNALSYPWSQAQLSASFDGFQPLAVSPVWATDTAQQSQFASWNQQSGASVTSGSVQTHSYDKSSSVGGSILGQGGGETVDYSRSRAVGTMFSSATTVGESAGMGVNKPGTFLDPLQYRYPVQNFIFGQNNPAGTAQQMSVDATVKATGSLRAGFIADPSGAVGSGAGGWWKDTYSVPDVALNHPARWSAETKNNATGANCLRFDPSSPASQCVTFNAPDLKDLPSSEFHWMRGFFVTQASALGTGPQTTFATAGDQLLLQVRVYNYSLVDMAPGTTVHVSFYGQEIGTDGAFQGASFHIGDQTIGPIPGFNSPTAGANPNWSMASTTFDTRPYPDTSLVFWVVVWMQDAEGKLVPELAEHGLARLPGVLTSLAHVPIETFSNNVGYYNQPIYIAPVGAGAPAAGPPSQIALEEVAVAPAMVATSEKTIVTARLRAGGAGEFGVLVRFFDGDPARGGRMFDAELVPHIRPRETWTARVPFRPRTCGEHRIFVVARGQTGDPVQRSTALEVAGTPGQGSDCPLTALSAFSGEASRVGDGTVAGEVRLAGRFALGSSHSLDLTGARVTILSLLTETGGGGELVDRVADGPVQLHARRGGRATSGTFESDSAAGQPLLRMVLKRRTDGLVEFSLRVSRPVLSQSPLLCSADRPSTTPLATRFVIDDGRNPRVEIATQKIWECTGRPPQVERSLRAR